MERTRRKRDSNRGFSLLEQAMVLPILLGFVFGAFDIANYLRAYTALQEGTRVALRCTSTTDGKCMNASVVPTRDMFHVFLPPLYNWQYKYEGDARWIGLPNYTYSSFTKRVLNDVRFDAPTANYSIFREYFPAQGRYVFLVETTPAVRQSGAPYLDPENFNPGGNLLSLSGGITLRAPRNGSSSTDSIYFTVSNPVNSDPLLSQSTDCLTQPRSNRGHCDDNPVNNLQIPNGDTRIFLNLKGMGSLDPGTGSDAEGAVEINLYHNNRLVHSLGGRRFESHSSPNNRTGSTHAHFVPRGFDRQNMSDWCSANGNLYYPNECEAYGKKLKVEYGKRYEIRFQLHHRGGAADVLWRLSEAQAATPGYEVIQEHAACSEALRPTQMKDKVCASGHEASPVVEVLPTSSTPSFVDNELSSGCSPETPTRDSILASHNLGQSLWIDYGTPQTKLPNTCSPHVTKPCSDPIGVPEIAVWSDIDQQNVIIDPAHARTQCPTGTGENTPILNVRWTERNDSLNHEPFSVLEKDCSYSKLSPPRTDWPSDMREFPKVSFASPTILTHSPHYTGEQDPIEVKTNTPAYQCPDVSIEGRRFTEETTPITSLFHGAQWDLGCEWQQTLKEEAERLGLDSRAYFEGRRPWQSETRSLFSIGAGVIDACTDVLVDRSLDGEANRSLLGDFEAGQYPAQCYFSQNGNAQNICLSQFAGSIPTGDAPGAAPNEDAARAEAHKAIQALFPSVKTGECSGTYCPQVAISFTPEDDVISASATMDIPLILLGNKTTKITYRNHERWEGAFAR